MKKIFIFLTTICAMFMLVACSKQNVKNDDAQSTQTSSSTLKKHNTKNAMNFDQIKAGNYSSLTGKWKLVKATARNQDITSTTQSSLDITKTDLVDDQIKMNASGIQDEEGKHPLTFKKEQGALVANLSNEEDAAINYSVKFYPAGVSNEYSDGSKNLIVIWTSNNSYTEAFEEQASDNGGSSSFFTKKKSKSNNLWNASKDEKLSSFIDKWSVTMDQDYQKYDGVNDIETSTGTTYPRDLSNVMVKGQNSSIGWSKDGKGSYDYNVVAIYNHDGDVPPLPNHITYFFAYHNGEPVVLVDQSRDGTPDLGETQNAQLKAGFDRIAEN